MHQAVAESAGRQQVAVHCRKSRWQWKEGAAETMAGMGDPVAAGRTKSRYVAEQNGRKRYR